MATHSKLASVALLAGAGVFMAAAWCLVYMLRRDVNRDIFEDHEFQSSQHSVIEVPVSNKIVGEVIGRNGIKIKKIEETTSTRINLNPQDKDKETRTALIRGKPNNVQAAERLLRKLIAERMSITTTKIVIPSKMCGFLIGKQGANIRLIQDTSKAKVDVERHSSTSQDVRTVSIKGSPEEIEYAKAMIEEIMSKAKESKKGDPKLSTANKQITYKDRQLAIGEDTSKEAGDASQVQPLVPSGQDGFLGVFISSAVSPSLFWVQPVGILATTLDKLVESMTDFYEDEQNWEEYKLEKMEVGDLVAAPFPGDNAIYRSRILSVEINDYDEDDSVAKIYYVDFGDYAEFKKKDMYALYPDFLKLQCQASECMLAGIGVPAGSCNWSEEAIKTFVTLSSCAQWKNLMLRIVEKHRSGVGSDEHDVLVVELVDTKGDIDVNIAQELIACGHAQSTIDSIACDQPPIDLAPAAATAD